MPLYEYQCPCGVKFESRVSMKEREKPVPCPDCGQDATQTTPSQVQGHFAKTVTGPVPQNTGIHDLDTHIDRVIGQSAEQGWGVVRERVEDKKEVINNNPGATGYDLSRNQDGTYRVLTPEERGIHERSQKIHQAAMEHPSRPRLRPRPR